MKNPINDASKAYFIDKVQKPRIVTCDKGVIVTYVFSNLQNPLGTTIQALFNPEETDQKIKEILNAYPQADLKAYEKALGITITNVQRAPDQPTDDAAFI